MPEVTAARGNAKSFLTINLPLSPPENEQLAYIHMNRRDFDIFARRSETLGNRSFESFGGAAYRVTIRIPGVADSYFTDGPFVWSMVDPEGNVSARNTLAIVNAYALAFFDRHLKSGSNQLLNGTTLPFRNVEVKAYLPSPLPSPK